MLNLGVHKPKKDQCSTCITYSNVTAEEKHKNTDYEEYITNKNLAKLKRQNLKRGQQLNEIIINSTIYFLYE